MSTNKKVPFEVNLKSLEDIVEQLESGQLSLDDSMKAFESGVKLTRDCQQSLASAEQKVQVLIEKNGDMALQPLNTQESE